MSAKKFYVILLLFTAVFGALAGYLHDSGKAFQDVSALLLYATVGYFFILTAVTFFLSQQNLSRSNTMFHTATLGSITIRMFLSLIFLVVYMVMNKPVDVSFVVFFAILYLFFNVFEISVLVLNLRPFSGKE